MKQTNDKSPKLWAKTFFLYGKTEWNETEGAARLLREMRVYVRHLRLKAEEAHGPPLDKRAPAVKRNVHSKNHQSQLFSPFFFFKV
ncbi:hypothetical protein [Peribacillus muralis]|uniref:hypothetical protein n=1 Tax=Peribacillus muralis TaxID=264697 RepID=UPI00366C01AA